MGIVYDTSLKDQYGGLNLDDELVYMPFGVNQENKPLSLVKDVVIEEEDDSDKDALIYTTTYTTLTGTVAINGTTAVVGTGTAFDTELTEGDYIIVAGEVKQVRTITDATNLVMTDAFAGTASGETATIDTDYDKPVYLSTSGDYVKLKPASGTIQKVGYITGGKTVRIYLYNAM